jgi:hypothetical protein
MPASVEKIEDLQSQGNVEDLFKPLQQNVDIHRDLVSNKLIGFC